VNYGVPFVVLCTKADIIAQIEKTNDGDRRLEFITYSLRNYCVQCIASTSHLVPDIDLDGAGLIYASVKDNINIDVVADYIGHRLFDFPLKIKPDATHRESVFVPAGFDTPKIIK
jgi:dynein light intermediate chain 1